jgi:hypothetical protein
MRKVLGDRTLFPVDKVVTSSGTTARLTHSLIKLVLGVWLQVAGYDLFVRCLWTTTSTAVASYLTSLKCYLYPLSTVPIVITTNFNKLIMVRS